MRRLAGALSIAALAWASNAAAAPAPLDAARLAAIDEASQAFLALAKDAYKTGAPPRQASPEVGKLLAPVFDTGSLNGPGSPSFAETAALNNWLARLGQIGEVYILAGTGIADPAKAGDIDATVKAQIAANTVAYAPEIGCYIDADLAVMQAEIAAIVAHMTEDPTVFATAKAQEGLNRTKTSLARTLAGVVTTMPTPGLEPAWPAARLPALNAIAPLAAAFLDPEDRRQLQAIAARASDRLSDKAARAGLAAFAKTIAP